VSTVSEPSANQDDHVYDVEAAWRGEAWYWDHVYNETPWGLYYTRTVLRHLRRATREHQVKTILDVGAGTGRFAIPLHLWGHAVTALDLDARALEALAAKQSGIRTVCGEFTQIETEHHDMIVSIGTVKYMKSFERFLDTSCRTLDQGGVLFCEMVNPKGARSTLKGIQARMHGRAPASTQFPTELTPSHCAAALQRAGFRCCWTRGACVLIPGHASRSYLLYRIGDTAERILLVDRGPAVAQQCFFLAEKQSH
jgi:2-polyprenyl-3-methyl-5-hydroxy-6-metoxy-1,4-benzoquinol methylase